MTGTALDDRLNLLNLYLRDSNAVERWRAFIRNSSDDELHRINAFDVAGRWQIDSRIALTEFIHATRAGLVALNWDVICGMCGFANKHEHLGSVSAIQKCEACGNHFDVSFDDTIEVTFTIHAAVRALAPSTARPASSARRVTGLDCATLPAFREFFAAEILSRDESLQVRDVAIMFTDIKGSTELYNRLGDARAYGAVRRHFDVLFEKVASNGGAIVKTIGDSVMASFTRSLDGVRAALAAQESFTGFRPLLPEAADEIIVKIGIHHGACIAVTLNERLDFFGSAINIAARTQQQAHGGETLITEATYRDSEVQEALKASGRAITKIEASLRGFSEKFVLYRIAASGQAKSRFPLSLRNLLR